jgi:WhiB family redox-sensing transcriptional regulator
VTAATDLFGALGIIPSLPGAQCRGRATLFDGGDGPDDPRTKQAALLCRGCPSLKKCSEWVDTQSPAKLHGVLAGRLYTWVPYRVSRNQRRGTEIESDGSDR